MNLYYEFNNLILYYLILLDGIYSFIIKPNSWKTRKMGLGKTISISNMKRSSSENELEIYEKMTKPSYIVTVPAKELPLDDPSSEHIKIQTIEYFEDGEVTWEIPVTIYQEKTITEYRTNANPHVFIDTTIVESHVQISDWNVWQSVLSGLVKGLNREFFRAEWLYDIFMNNLAGRGNFLVNGDDIFFILFASMIRYLHATTSIREINLLKTSYKMNDLETMRQYLRIKRFATSFFILIIYIFTKNVKIVE